MELQLDGLEITIRSVGGGCVTVPVTASAVPTAADKSLTAPWWPLLAPRSCWHARAGDSTSSTVFDIAAATAVATAAVSVPSAVVLSKACVVSSRKTSPEARRGGPAGELASVADGGGGENGDDGEAAIAEAITATATAAAG
eukprot:CAMPEP_0171919458 /NCGR_PEP_ID=MMETSP0993-20121228/18165_1 /TAXON_ID=483369 /ORGANISM="non described non described, Strain CCMP2098" /LENGTH=141 /DNA_ID=CAMNT_0012556131 /DNA_START=296 /DNA_END=721 /DNA_ORIENTATION=+